MQLEIIAESLTSRRPVLVYGNPVASAPSTPSQNFNNLSTKPPETGPSVPLGYSWPIRSKQVAQTANTSSARPIDFASSITAEEKMVVETASTSSSPSKITGYFSPSKKSSNKSSAGSDVASTAASSKVTSSPRTSLAKKVKI